MANKNYGFGFEPIPTGPDGIPTTDWVHGTGGSAALLMHSPYTLSAGQAVSATTTYAGDGTEVTGSVVALFDSNRIPVQKLAANAAGYVVGTYAKDQRYHAALDETHYAGDGDVGKRYDTTTEAGTAANDYSTIMLDSSTEAAANAIWVAGRLVQRFDNTAATAYCVVECSINPSCYCNPGIGV